MLRIDIVPVVTEMELDESVTVRDVTIPPFTMAYKSYITAAMAEDLSPWRPLLEGGAQASVVRYLVQEYDLYEEEAIEVMSQFEYLGATVVTQPSTH